MSSSKLRRLLWTAFCLLPVSAGPAAALVPVEPPVPRLAAPLADSLWEKIYGPLSASLGSQERMLQFCVVIVAVALLIIWWRK